MDQINEILPDCAAANGTADLLSATLIPACEPWDASGFGQTNWPARV